MVGFGPIKTFACGIASGTTVGAAVPIGGCSRVFVRIPTYTTGCLITVQVSDTATTGTFLNLHFSGVNSAGSGIIPYQFQSAVGGAVYEVSQACGMRYMKLQASIDVVDGAPATACLIR
jgi:hypothetical protein